MGSEDISAYTYERTLLMEQRQKMLKAMNLNRRESIKRNVRSQVFLFIWSLFVRLFIDSSDHPIHLMIDQFIDWLTARLIEWIVFCWVDWLLDWLKLWKLMTFSFLFA